MNAKSLVGYCGLYCGACGIYQRRIKQAVENLKQIIGAYGFDKMMPELAKWEPSLQHYEKFEKVMAGLIKLFGECPGCGDGGGKPQLHSSRMLQTKRLHPLCRMFQYGRL